MKTFRRLCAIVVVFAMCLTCVGAATIEGVDVTDDLDKSFQALTYDVVANKITVQGIAGYAEETMLTFYLTEGDKVVFADQVMTKADGTFSTTLVLDPSRYNGEVSGTLIIGASNTNTRKIEGIDLCTQIEMDACVDAFKKISDVNDLRDFLSKYASMLGIDAEFDETALAVMMGLYAQKAPFDVENCDEVASEIEFLVEYATKAELFVAEANTAAASGDWEELKTFIFVKYSQLVSVDTSLSTIRDERAMFMKMIENYTEYLTIGDIEDAFVQARIAQRDEETVDGQLTTDREKDFADEWKLAVNANLITVSGRTEEQGVSQIVFNVTENDFTEAEILALYMTDTNEDGTFTASFAVDPTVYGDCDKAVLKISGKNRNIWQFVIPLYGNDVLEQMTEDFNGISSASETGDFLDEYSSILGLCEGYGDDKVAMLYDLYSDCNEDNAEVPEQVAKTMSTLSNGVTEMKAFIDDMNKYSKKKLWGYIKDTIEENYAELAEKSATFRELFDAAISNKKVSKNGIYLRMVGLTFETVQDVLDAYNEAYEAQREFEATKNTGGNGGGGGGGVSLGGASATGSGKTQDYEIGGEFVQTEEPEKLDESKMPVGAFSDLAGYDWAADAINGLRQAGILRGDGNGTFRPGDSMTREELLTMLLAVFYVDVEDADAPFGDIIPGAWYCDVVGTAYKKGITNGMGDGTFGIGTMVIRADMVVLASRLMKEQKLIYSQDTAAFVFGDFLDIPEYAYNDVSGFQQAGFVKGDDKGCFNPMNNVTRAEAAVMFWNIYSAVLTQL